MLDKSLNVLVDDNLVREEKMEKQKPKVFPFVVSIQVYTGTKYKHQCGGSILNSQFVVSAAHCTLKPSNLSAKDLYVEAGSNLLFDTNATRIQVKAMKTHPEFRPLGGNDILLLQLSEELRIDDIQFGTIEYHNVSRTEGHLNAWLLGWGHTVPGVSKELEIIPFQTMEDKACFLEYRFKYLTDSEICAYNSGGPRGACDGDSGAPLVDATNHTIYGILSYGRNPCEAGKPYAFTRLSVYVKWIDREMEKMLGNSNKSVT